MLLSIFILKAMSLVAVVTLIISGHYELKPLGLPHPFFAMPSILLIYINEVLTIFYFIQTGRGMKDDAEEMSIDLPELSLARANHGAASKTATINMLVITLAAILGGITIVSSVGSVIHGLVALACVILFTRGTFKSFGMLWKNSEYMNLIAENYANFIGRDDSPGDSESSVD